MFFKSITTWLFVVILATIHIRFQKAFIAPGIGELTSHIIGTLIWSGAILVIALIFISQCDIENSKTSFQAGLIWFVSSILLLIVEKLVMKEASISFAPDNLLSMDGFFLCLNLLFILVAPRIAFGIYKKLFVTR